MTIQRRIRLATVAVLLCLSPMAALAQPVVGVLGIASEVVPIERLLQDSRDVVVRGYVFRRGSLNGRQVVVGRSGAGKVNAAIVATLLIGEFSPSVLFNSGTAGAVDPTLRPGDVVIGATMVQHDAGLQTANGLRRRGMRNAVTGELDPLLVRAPEMLLALARQSAQRLTLPPVKTPEGDLVPRVLEGVIVTGDVFLSDAVRREELRSTLGATAVEMEGAAIVQTCRQFAVSCLVVRSITDSADSKAQVNYEQFIAAASENAARLVAAIIGALAP